MTSFLAQRLPAGCVFEMEPMDRHTTFKIGGPADVYITPRSVDELVRVIALCREENTPFVVLGRGSNVLVPDEGIRRVVVQLYPHMKAAHWDGARLTAEAGAMLPDLATQALAAGFSGLEFAAGIPGTLGGAITMNAGAYDGEMAHVCESVTLLLPNGEVATLSSAEMHFGYRQSAVAGLGAVVLSATLRLTEAPAAEVKAKMDDFSQRRRAKQPLEFPSAGSAFKRPPGHFAGKLIEDAGLKGHQVGGAQVSPKHAGFIINTGGATAADVQALVAAVQQAVLANAGIALEPEMVLL